MHFQTCEDMIHANVHVTLGGAGGSVCADVDAQLKSQYGLSDSDIVDFSSVGGWMGGWLVWLV